MQIYKKTVIITNFVPEARKTGREFAMSLPILFAPLQGLTESTYRRAHAAVCGGVEAYYSPFLRLEHGQIRRRDLRDIATDDDRLVPQVIAASVDEFRLLCSAVVEAGYSHVNLNMGCPFPPQVKAGRGVGLLRNAATLRAILAEISRMHDESGMSFSLKMRLGQDEADEWKAVIDDLNAAPLSHVIMHPRVGRQQYKGDTDMRAFAEFYTASSHPVVYNGDLTSVDDIRSLESQFPCLEAVMIGRGLLARPVLAQEYLSGSTMSDDQLRSSILRIHEMVLADYERTLEGGDGQILSKIQPFWEYPGVHFDRKFVKKLTKTGSLAAYRKILSEASL